MATATPSSMFTPTRELPLWINRTKVARISELDGQKNPITVKSDQPVVLPLPAGGSFTVPPGGIIVGKYFENCRGWKALQPVFTAVDRSKILDPLNLLSGMGEEESWMGSLATGEKTCYGKTRNMWRDYFKVAKDAQVSQEYGKRKVLGRIYEFCGIAHDAEAGFPALVSAARQWATETK